MVRTVYIVSATRTAIGKFMGSLTPLSAMQLGATAIKGAVQRAGIEDGEIIDEVIMGNVLTAGLGQNPARQALIYSGLPESKGAFTINKVCGSGLKAVMLAAQAIKAGDAELIVAGGMENMSNAPFMLSQARQGVRMGHSEITDVMIKDGLWDVYNNFHMGNTAELVAEKYGITREMQDEYACNSHKKAVNAIKEGKFKAEITTVEIPQRKKEAVMFNVDEGPREDTAIEKLATLAPAFKKGGSVTAGNASSINDGAAALVIASADAVKKYKLPVLAKISAYATGGVAPEWVMMAPLEAVKGIEKKTGMKPNDFDLIEINEAFSVAAVALLKEMKLDKNKVNICGGAVALGHPIGCSGARILTTLLYAMKDTKAKTGLATLCLGGGNAVALSVTMD